jgi:hypothetical protein
VHPVAGDPHDRDDLLDGGRVGWIAQAFVARRTAGVKAGHRRRRAATTGGIKNGRSGHELQTGIRPEAHHESAVHRAARQQRHQGNSCLATERERCAPPADAVAAAQSHGYEQGGPRAHGCSYQAEGAAKVPPPSQPQHVSAARAPCRPAPRNNRAVPGLRLRSAGRGPADDAARRPRRRAGASPQSAGYVVVQRAHGAAPATRSRPASG